MSSALFLGTRNKTPQKKKEMGSWFFSFSQILPFFFSWHQLTRYIFYTHTHSALGLYTSKKKKMVVYTPNGPLKYTRIRCSTRWWRKKRKSFGDLGIVPIWRRRPFFFFHVEKKNANSKKKRRGRRSFFFGWLKNWQCRDKK
jgi:hypothetical protein